jgi:MFS family permease
MLAWLKPKDTLDEADLNNGLRMILYDGICTQLMGIFTGGAFLVAFALLLGASNRIIGFIAAIGPLAHILQIPTVFLVDRVRLRKFLVVVSSFLSRLFWFVVAAIPWLVPENQRLSIFVVCIFCYYGLGTVSGTAWSSWIRDFVPEKILGRFFSKRLAIATAIGAVVSILAGYGVDLYKNHYSSEIGAYSILFLLGAGAGLIGVSFLSRIPEPRMARPSHYQPLSVLANPFRDKNFRQLLIFLGTWNFAINLAAPFFVVYMLKRLHLNMGSILILSVLSQFMNVLSLRLWGLLADRFSHKSVLIATSPLFILSIILWPFTTMPESYIMTIPILIVIHILAGISLAGITLCTGTIALKAAPRGDATAYLATNSLISGLTATIAPIIAGFLADWFSTRELSINLRWSSTAEVLHQFEVPALNLRGLDFLFIISVIAGLYALHRLIAIREEGEVKEKIGLTELYSQVRKAVRHVSNVAGLRTLTYFPFGRLNKSQHEKPFHYKNDTHQ